MKNYIKLTIIAVAALGITACTDDVKDSKELSYDQFIAESEVSASINGVVVKRFDQSTDQVVYNDNNTIFMLSDMNYTSQFTLTLNGTFEVGNIVSVYYKSNLSDALTSGNSQMSVVKADTADSRYWLWDSETNIGFVVDFDF